MPGSNLSTTSMSHLSIAKVTFHSTARYLPAYRHGQQVMGGGVASERPHQGAIFKARRYDAKHTPVYTG